MNTKPQNSKISTSASGNSLHWELPAKKGIGFLMVFGSFFGGIPLLMLALTTFQFFFGNGESEFDSVWEFLALFGFLGIFVCIGSIVFYFGFKIRYTSFKITAHSGSVEVLKKFWKKEHIETLGRGSVHGVGLYSNSETNGKPDYGLLVKANDGQDIKISNGYREDELRWLASEVLAELDLQGGLPSDVELEESYFRSDTSISDGEPMDRFVKKGVTVALLDEAQGDHFVIEKNGSTIAKSMLFGGLFGILFSSVFILVGFGSDDGEFIAGLAGCLFATVSFLLFILGITKLGTTEKYIFKTDTIIKENLRRGVSKSKEVFQKASFNKLTVASSGNSNNETRYSVKIIRRRGGKKPLKLFSWVDQEVSDVVKLKVDTWLKSPPVEPEKPSFESGYGSAMKTAASQQNIVGKHSQKTRTQPSDVPIYNANVKLKDIKGGVWMLRIFLTIFLSLGLGLTIFGVLNFLTAKDSETWPSATGTILSSKTNSNSSDDGTTYGADVSYRFKVDGKSYEGDKVTISEVSTSNRRRAVKIIHRYPIGKKVAVYYQPSNPDSNVLETGVSSGSWLLPGVGFIFFLVALGVLIFTELSRRKEREKKKADQYSVKNIQSRYGKVE